MTAPKTAEEPRDDRRTGKLFVNQSTIPMALVASDGAVEAESSAWSRLFASTPPPSDVRLQVTGLPDDAGFLVVASDLSPMGQEIEELRARADLMQWQALSMSTFAKVLADAPIVLFSMDATGTTTMSDGKGLALVGLEPGERVGTNELDAARGTPVHDHLLRALGGETVRVLIEPRPGVYFETWYMPLRNESHELDGVLGLSIDATDRVKTARRLVEKTRVVERQTETIRNLAAPIIKVWDEVVCMPIVGAVDTARATDMMEHLLEAIVREQARFAIVDLTGVETMDTSTVHHVLRLFGAARMLGVEGVLSGARPSVAQTVVSLGICLDELRMVRTLHDALSWCLSRRRAQAARRSPSQRPGAMSWASEEKR